MFIFDEFAHYLYAKNVIEFDEIGEFIEECEKIKDITYGEYTKKDIMKSALTARYKYDEGLLAQALYELEEFFEDEITVKIDKKDILLKLADMFIETQMPLQEIKFFLGLIALSNKDLEVSRQEVYDAFSVKFYETHINNLINLLKFEGVITEKDDIIKINI